MTKTHKVMVKLVIDKDTVEVIIPKRLQKKYNLAGRRGALYVLLE